MTKQRSDAGITQQKSGNSYFCVTTLQRQHFVCLADKNFYLTVYFTLSDSAQVWAAGPWKKGSLPQASRDLPSHCLVCHCFHTQTQSAGSSSCHSALLELLSPLTCPCHCSRPGHQSPASFGCHWFHASAHPHRWSLGSWVCAPLGLPRYNLCLALGHGRATDYWVFYGGCAAFALDLQNYHHYCHLKHCPHLVPPAWASTGGWTCCGCSPHFQGALGSLGCCQYHIRWRAGLISGCDDHY